MEKTCSCHAFACLESQTEIEDRQCTPERALYALTAKQPLRNKRNWQKKGFFFCAKRNIRNHELDKSIFIFGCK